MSDQVEDFLAHYGVKGMKWGVRSDSSSRSTSPSKRKETMKALGKELAVGSVGPAAVIAGLGPPASLALGLSVAALSKPPVQRAIAKSAKSSADLMKEIGNTKLSVMRAAEKTTKR